MIKKLENPQRNPALLKFLQRQILKRKSFFFFLNIILILLGNLQKKIWPLLFNDFKNGWQSGKKFDCFFLGIGKQNGNDFAAPT